MRKYEQVSCSTCGAAPEQPCTRLPSWGDVCFLDDVNRPIRGHHQARKERYIIAAATSPPGRVIEVIR